MAVPDHLVRKNDFVFSASADPAWLLVEEGVDPAREREIEIALCRWQRLSWHEGNGRQGFQVLASFDLCGRNLCRGWRHRTAACRTPTLVTRRCESREEVLSPRGGSRIEHRRVLDLRQGVLSREWRQQDPSGRIARLTYVQLASLADRHVLLQSVSVTAENYAGSISLTARLALRIRCAPTSNRSSLIPAPC